MGCKFKHEHSKNCKFDKKCNFNPCQFKHSQKKNSAQGNNDNINDNVEIDNATQDVEFTNTTATVISDNGLSSKSLEVIQNIQDVSYNCSKLLQAKDELEATTIFTPHESDSETKYEVHL